MNKERKIRIQQKIIEKQEQLIEQLNQTITSLLSEISQLKEQSESECLVISEMMDDLVYKNNELKGVIDTLNGSKEQYNETTIELDQIKKSYIKQMNKIIKSAKRNNR